jgi:hypothetical protein
MINIVSPRIHNLGDFAHCLPALSGLYKLTGDKMHLIICDRLQRFSGLKELLLGNEMFAKVSFICELNTPSIEGILIDDTGYKGDHGPNSAIAHKYANFIKENYRIDFQIDDDFELQIPFVPVDSIGNNVLVGDRWSPKDAPDVDDRRLSNLIEGSGVLSQIPTTYLDYTKDLVYNCNLIKSSQRPFVTTVTGIAVLSDLMKKETIVLYDDDMNNWNNKTIDEIFSDHFYLNRKTSLQYIKSFDQNRLIGD